MIIDWPEVNQDDKSDRVWADCIRHCSTWRSFYAKGDFVTSCHEITHGINNEIRNKHTEKKYNAFYLLDNKAILMEEPNFRKSQVNQFVPANLRASRFGTYLQGMGEWEREPLYLLDEMSAYINGAYCATQLRENGEGSKDNFDWAFSVEEFLVYSLALLVACEKFSPTALDSLRQDFVVLWKRGWDAYEKCIKVFPWQPAAAYLENFKGNQELQAFIERMKLNEDNSKPDFSSI